MASQSQTTTATTHRSAFTTPASPSPPRADLRLSELTRLSRRLGFYWYFGIALLCLMAISVAALDVMRILDAGAGLDAAGVERLTKLIGLVGLILVFILFITVKRRETGRLRADLEAQRIMTSRIESRTGELEGAIEKLKALDRMKDSFISSVSHEIRTPLTAIQSYSEVLMTREETPADVRREFLGVINRESRRLAVLINDLQDLARLEAGRVELHTTTAALGPLLDEALETTGILARDKQIELSTEIASGLPRIRVDAPRFVRVLTNLIGNAVKFTPRGGSIRVRAYEEQRPIPGSTEMGRFVRLSVRDTGAGIPGDQIPHVFDRFYRGKKHHSVEGTGLGLAIAKEIVEKLGGEIWVESAPDVGTTFRLTAPVAGRAKGSDPAAAPPESLERPA